MIEAATDWLERWWDERVGMVGYPSTLGSPNNPYQQPGVHLVRETAVWAVALLARGRAGDVARAERALANVLDHQIDDPRSVAHGTWRRAPGELMPGPGAREWIDYDPNWREFVGSALVLALVHEGRLSPAIVARIDHALRRACDGMLRRSVPSEYTNIALMNAFVLDWVGDRLGDTAYRRAGEALGLEVADAYTAQGAFAEHNSPTYYGIDLYGLALWRAHARSAPLRQSGAALEAALWRDLARFYHAGLRNLCGPYTRAYGMDMTRYVATLGCWLAAVVSKDEAPLPSFGDSVDHAHDFFELPLIGVLESRPPEDIRAELQSFGGPRSVEQQISQHPARRATARLIERAMWGGEHTGGRFIHWQHHPATIHWKMPDGGIGWLRLVANAPVDAVADEDGLDVAVHTGLEALRTADLHVLLECWPSPPAAPDRTGAIALPGIALRIRGDVSPSLDPGAVAVQRPAVIGWRFGAGTAPRELRFRIEVSVS